MTVELLYTSAPNGLKQGSRGFCTVLSTVGMPVNLAQRLEALSGYRQVFPPQDKRVADNPVCYSHLRVTIGGRQQSILSRIAAYGVDYTQRTNKLAHHVVLDPQHGDGAGPAWLLRQQGVMRTEWNGECETVPQGPILPTGDLSPAICSTWDQLAGDAGWAGVVVEAWMRPAAGKPVWVIFDVEQSHLLLEMMEQATSIMPESKRWQATFTTYFTNLPPDVDCRVRCVLAGSDEARMASARGTVIDLTKPSALSQSSIYIDAARSGSPFDRGVSAVVKPVASDPPEDLLPPKTNVAESKFDDLGVLLPPNVVAKPTFRDIPRYSSGVEVPDAGFSKSSTNNKYLKIAVASAMVVLLLLLTGGLYLVLLSNPINIAKEEKETTATKVEETSSSNETTVVETMPKTVEASRPTTIVTTYDSDNDEIIEIPEGTLLEAGTELARFSGSEFEIDQNCPFVDKVGESVVVKTGESKRVSMQDQQVLARIKAKNPNESTVSLRLVPLERTLELLVSGVVQERREIRHDEFFEKLPADKVIAEIKTNHPFEEMRIEGAQSFLKIGEDKNIVLAAGTLLDYEPASTSSHAFTIICDEKPFTASLVVIDQNDLPTSKPTIVGDAIPGGILQVKGSFEDADHPELKGAQAPIVFNVDGEDQPMGTQVLKIVPEWHGKQIAARVNVQLKVFEDESEFEVDRLKVANLLTCKVPLEEILFNEKKVVVLDVLVPIEVIAGDSVSAEKTELNSQPLTLKNMPSIEILKLLVNRPEFNSLRLRLSVKLEKIQGISDDVESVLQRHNAVIDGMLRLSKSIEADPFFRKSPFLTSANRTLQRKDLFQNVDSVMAICKLSHVLKSLVCIANNKNGAVVDANLLRQCYEVLAEYGTLHEKEWEQLRGKIDNQTKGMIQQSKLSDIPDFLATQETIKEIDTFCMSKVVLDYCIAVDKLSGQQGFFLPNSKFVVQVRNGQKEGSMSQNKARDFAIPLATQVQVLEGTADLADAIRKVIEW